MEFLNLDRLKERFSSMSMLMIIFIALFIIMSLIMPAQFLSLGNFQSIAFQLPELGILALAMMITMVSGGINLSIIAGANLSGIVMAMIMTSFIADGTPFAASFAISLLAILLGLLVALLIGILNGFLIAYVNVSPILTTLGTMTLVQGISVGVTKGYVISGFPAGFQTIGNNTLLGIPVPMLIFILIVLVMSIILNRSTFGISVYMLGSNKTATSFSGINIKKVTMKIYAISGLLTGLAAIIMISRFNSASAGYSTSYLLVTVLLAVLGGVNPDGGFGRISGIVMALLILQVISSGLNLMQVSSQLSKALWGIILILVIALRYYSDKFKLAQRT
jgi:simple sugar transport system permease protein